jgi:uncharacterized protein (TIGR03435 family)
MRISQDKLFILKGFTTLIGEFRSSYSSSDEPPSPRFVKIAREVVVMVRSLASVALSALLSTPTIAAATAAVPSCEAADVHASPYRRFPDMDQGSLRGDRYVLRQATMVDLIATAYGVDQSYVQGGSIWLESDRFDVIAKAPAGTSPATLKLMLKSLLADRFKLVVHPGDMALPAYVLSAGKGKPKLQEAAGSGDAECKDQEPPEKPELDTVRQIVIACHHSTMAELAKNLQDWAGGYLSYPVTDSTGLKGSFDFEIKWTPRALLQKAGADGISIFDAVDKEMGHPGKCKVCTTDKECGPHRKSWRQTPLPLTSVSSGKSVR